VPSLTRGRICKLLVEFTVVLGSKSRRTYDHILLFRLRLSQSGGAGPHIYIHQEQCGTVLLAGTSLFVASYDSQDYDDGILTHLHTAMQPLWPTHDPCHYNYSYINTRD
jgi:hypothetical protein